jgi:hypothetical protein
MLIEMLMTLALSQALTSASAATIHTCASPINTEISLSSYNVSQVVDLRPAINAALQSANPPLMTMRLRLACCPNGTPWSIPAEGWATRMVRGGDYAVTISKLDCL